ncbi:Gfo/Idh/MocA family protein [Halomarina ordinaria]|uniref:Gfo/Idh/MocA family oxidoreductase n=1 Tax=Halomarina ordinaria TaxID=3033939 RepID=A0ABD5U9B8_9EURY|nr:Gfo/Idh/MocA family oxidoreductase [Halomarina sp. PSRA2]
MTRCPPTPVRAGVVGVGSIGQHHARNYANLSGAELVGVVDTDVDRAAGVAEEYGTTACSLDELFASVDAVSVAVPTTHHHQVASTAIDRGVHVLVEKPLASSREECLDLIARARANGVTLQVGHVERFNPAVEALGDIVADLDLIAVEAHRLGPPLSREMDDTAVLDLMIHDIDVVLSLVDEPVVSVDARGVLDNQHVTATLSFENGVIATLTASRVTQQKVRQLSVTAADCRVNTDYTDQSVMIHRQSVPEYVENWDSISYRSQSVIELPTIETGEPLERELVSFLDSVRSGDPPVVTGEDGYRAFELAMEIDRIARGDEQLQSQVP